MGTARGVVEIDAASIGRAEQAFRFLGTRMLGLGAVAIAGFAGVASVTADFESRMSAAGAVLNATEEDMEALRTKALELGQQTIFSGRDVATAMEEMAKAGLTVPEILNGAADAAVALSAAAGDIGLDQAAVIMANAMKTFGASSGELTHFVDVMAGAANSSTISMSDLATSMTYVGPVAASAGIGFEELNTALAVLGDRGIRGSTAGTSLRGILVSLQGSSGPATAALKELGIITEDGANKFFDAEGRVKSFAEIAQVLQDATAGLTDEQKINAMNTIFQRRAMASALIMAEQGAAGFAQYSDAISKISAADVAARKLDNLSGDVEKLKSALESAIIATGSPVQETLRGWTQQLTSLVEWFTNLDSGTQQFILNALGIIGVGALLAGTFALTIGQFIKFYKVMNDLVSTARKAHQALMLFKSSSAVVGVLGSLKSGFMAAAAGVKAFSLSLLTNPVFLIIAGLIALGAAIYALYKNNEGVRKFIDGLWQSIQKGWDAVLGFLKKVPPFFMDLFEKIKGYISTGINWIKSNWDILLAIFTGPFGLIILIVRRFGDDIVSFFQSLPSRVVGLVQGLIESIIGFITTLPERAGQALGLLIGTWVRVSLEILNFLVENVPKWISTVVDFISELPGKVWDFLVEVVTKVATWSLDMVTKAGEMGLKFLEKVVEFFTQLPGKVWDFLVAVVTNVINWAVDMNTRATNAGRDFLNGVVNFIKDLPGRVAEHFTNTMDNVKSFVVDILAKAKQIGENFLEFIMEKVRQIPEAVKGIFDRVVQVIKDVIRSAFNAVKDFASGLWEGFKEGMGISSPSYIEEAMFAMTKNVGSEINKLAGQVTQMERLGLKMGRVNFDSIGPSGSIRSASQIAAGAAAMSGGGNTTISVNTIEIAAKDLEEMRTVTDFFDKVEQVARQGVLVG